MFLQVCIKVTLKKRSAKDLPNDVYTMFVGFFVVFFSDFLYKNICCRYPFELHQQVDAIQMGTHNICLCRPRQEVNWL